jgi:hypothetical protein
VQHAVDLTIALIVYGWLALLCAVGLGMGIVLLYKRLAKGVRNETEDI